MRCKEIWLWFTLMIPKILRAPGTEGVKNQKTCKKRRLEWSYMQNSKPSVKTLLLSWPLFQSSLMQKVTLSFNSLFLCISFKQIKAFTFCSKPEMQPSGLETGRLTAQPGPTWAGKSLRLSTHMEDRRAFQLLRPPVHVARHTDHHIIQTTQYCAPIQLCLPPRWAQLLLHWLWPGKEGGHPQSGSSTWWTASLTSLPQMFAPP